MIGFRRWFSRNHHFLNSSAPCAKVGFNLLVDRTGKLLHTRKKICKKDIIANPREPCQPRELRDF